MKTSLLKSVLFCCFLFPVYAYCDTNHPGGVISSNETWTLADSPHIVQGNIIVNTGVTLTIQAGATVKFDAGYGLTINGTLIAPGTSTSRTTFTSSATSPSPNDWAYIYFTDDSNDALFTGAGSYVSGSILEYCIIEYAGSAGKGAIYTKLAHPYIRRCTIRYNGAYGVYSEQINPDAADKPYKIHDNLIHDNSGGIFGQFSIYACQVEFWGNTIVHNSGYGLDLTMFNVVQGTTYYPANIRYNEICNNSWDGMQIRFMPAIITDNYISHNGGYGLNYYYGHININGISYTANTITQNAGGGAMINYADACYVYINNLFSNGNYQLYNSGSAAINATFTYWGTTTSADIPALIYDALDNGAQGLVDYDPFATAIYPYYHIPPPVQVVKQQQGNDVYLRWSPVNVSDLTGYNIHYGSRDGATYSSRVNAGNDTTYLLAGASVIDKIYVTAYDNSADGVNDLAQEYESWYEEAIRGLAITLSPTHVNCNGGSNGAINLSTQYGFTPFSYAWSNGATTQDISSLLAGTYSVTVTDAQGFTASGSVEITEPDLLESLLLPDDITCFGGNDGAIDATITGGTTSYSYSWTGPGDYTAYQQDITGLEEGKYVLNITDAKGCSVKDSVILSYEHELPVPVITFPDSNKICNGDSLELDAGAGYTDYLWSTTETSRIIYAKTEGDYTVTVTDANGCSNSDDETITVYPLPTSSFSAPTSLCAEELAVLTYTGNATSSAAYDWLTDGGTIQSGSNQGPLSVSWFAEGTKMTGLSVVENGCKSDTSFNDVEVFQIPTSLFSLQATVCDDENVIIEYQGNASPIANYTWQTGDANVVAGSGAGPVIVNWATGGIKTIQLTVDEDGCFSGTTENQIYVAYPYEEEGICIVTIDSITGKNLLVWEKTPDAGILQYNLHRETEVSGVYEPMDVIPAGMLSVYVDDESNPEERQFLYKLSVTDTCGNESALSPYHKTLFLQYDGTDLGVNLRWDKYEIEGNLVNFNSYIIFRGSDSTQLSQVTTISGSLTSWTDLDPLAQEGRQFYRIAGVKGDTCRPEGTQLKAGTGPYNHSLSNLEDNRMRGTGTKSIYTQQHLIIYPNPLTSSTYIRFYNPDRQAYTLYITDLSGKVLRVTGDILESEYLLERNGLEKGYYMIRLVGEQGGSYFGKIVVQ